MKKCTLETNNQLLKKYASSMIEKSISTEALYALADLGNFPAAGDRAFDMPVSEENHSQSDALYDFVSVVAPQMDKEFLHRTVIYLLMHEAKTDAKTFLGNPCLAKHLLAYEFATNPDLAKHHFHQRYYMDPVADQGGVEQFNQIILAPVVKAFQPDSADQEDAHAEKIERIRQLNAQRDASKQESECDRSDETSAPISFFMVMSHPAVKFGAAALLIMGLVTLAIAGAALGGMALAVGLAAYATYNVIAGASAATALGLFALAAGAGGGKSESADEFEISSPIRS